MSPLSDSEATGAFWWTIHWKKKIYQASCYDKHNATNHAHGASGARALGFRCLACFASHPVSANPRIVLLLMFVEREAV